MQSYDLAILGNGILSFVSALQVSRQFPKLKIALVGPSDQLYSASVAAGAMHAVYCEVEETFYNSPRDQAFFKVGLESRALWLDLINNFGFHEVITADSTIMFSRKEGTIFEKLNFEAACKIAEDHNVLDDVSSDVLKNIFFGQLKSSEVIARQFKGEFAIDSERFFIMARAALQKFGVQFIETAASNIFKTESNGVEIGLQSGQKIYATRVFLAAGTNSSKLLPNHVSTVPVYHAVGTAMVLDSAPLAYGSLRAVVRTPNRGGAQCGMHIVPRNNKQFYLGAGNYLSSQEPAHRVETIRYLIDLCDKELFGKQTIYSAKSKMLLGSRPKSVDGFPLVGPLRSLPEIYMATGTYRIGLTIAPVIASDLCQWLVHGSNSGKFPNWEPERNLCSYGTLESATRYYSESRISNLVEHGLLKLEDVTLVREKKEELEAMAKKLNAEIVATHNLPSDFVVDPDMYAILSTTQPH